MICFFINDSSFLEWNLKSKIQRHLTTVWALLPVGSILTAVLIVLLMVLFSRCPMMIAALVTAILLVTILFITLMSFDERLIYT